MDVDATLGGGSWRNPSGLILPPLAPVTPGRPVGPLIHVRRRVADEEGRWRWHGRIIARAWPADMPTGEYEQMLVGGRAERLRAPDRYTADGAPVYILTDAEARAREDDLNRHALDVYETHNVACNAGRAAILNYVANTGGLTGVQYLAVGTGSIPAGQSGPQATDTALWTEYFRQAISTTTISGNQVDLSSVFASGSANTTYTEAGIFGDGATGTAGSGQLFAHALYTYTKNTGVVLTNDYYVTFS